VSRQAVSRSTSQAEALLEAQPMAGGLNELFFEGARHAVELQALEAG
jgi:hypothetical protein